MSFFVFRPQISTGARQLAEALGGRTLHRFDGRSFFRRTRGGDLRRVEVTPRDIVVAWGSELATPGNTPRVLNGGVLRNKYEDAVALRRANINTIEVSRTRPTTRATTPVTDPAVQVWDEFTELTREFGNVTFGRGQVVQDGINQLITGGQRLVTALRTAAPVQRATAPTGDWIGRDRNHVGGNDLLTPTTNPDYFVRKMNIVREFRVHCFLGRSIRAGIKAPREGWRENGDFNAARQVVHPWIRSWDGGWRILYDGVSSKQRHRDIAAAACQALGLDFGAVDIGELADRSVVVLEVNRAPGIEGGTVDKYVAAIQAWSAGTFDTRGLTTNQQRNRAA